MQEESTALTLGAAALHRATPPRWQGRRGLSSRGNVNEPNAAVGEKDRQYGMSWDKLASRRQLCREQPSHTSGLWWDPGLGKVQPRVWREKLPLLASVSQREKGLAGSSPGSQQLQLCIYKHRFPSPGDFNCVPEGQHSCRWWQSRQTQSHPCCVCLRYRNLGRPFSTWQCCCLIEPLCILSIFLSRMGKLVTPSLLAMAKPL